MSLQTQRNIPSFGTLISHRTISILGKSITLIGIAHNFSTFLRLWPEGKHIKYEYMGHRWINLTQSFVEFLLLLISISQTQQPSCWSAFVALNFMRFTTLFWFVQKPPPALRVVWKNVFNICYRHKIVFLPVHFLIFLLLHVYFSLFIFKWPLSVTLVSYVQS